LITLFTSWWTLLGFFFIKYHTTSLSISWLEVVLSKVVSLFIYLIYYVLEVDMFLLSGIMPSICCIDWTNITFKLYFGVSFEMMTLCQRFLIYPTSSSPLANLEFWPCRFLLKLNFENLLNLFAKMIKNLSFPRHWLSVRNYVNTWYCKVNAYWMIHFCYHNGFFLGCIMFKCV